MVDDELDDDASGGMTLQTLLGVLQMHRGVIMGCAAAGFIASALFTLVVTRQYTAVAVVHLAPVAAKEINTDGVQTDVTAGWNRNIDVATKLAVLDSNGLRAKVADRFQEVGGQSVEVVDKKFLKDAVDAQSRKGTELIDISVVTSDPDLSASLANIVGEVFCDESMAGMVEAARNAREWLGEQLVEYDERIKQATIDLNEFERENGLAGSGSDGELSLTARMTTLNTAYGELNTELVLQETLVKDFERLLNAGRYEDLAKSMDSALITSLTVRYADAVGERARVAAIYLEKMPERKAAEANVKLIEQELRREVRKNLSAEKAKLEMLKAKRDSLLGAIGTSKEQVLALQTLWGEYEQKRLELQHAKDFHQRLRARMGELELQSKTQFNRARVLERASAPLRPSFPIVYVNLAAGLVLGLVIGIGIAVLREWLDDSISSPLDVRTYLGVSCLGAVPKIEDETPYDIALYTHHNPRSPAAEAMRGVRTTLELSPSGTPRRILVTSAVAAEGKTSTAVRLALSFANAHRSVVLIDCDLRRPRLHKVFGGARENGVTNLIDGAEIQDVVRETPVPNVSYICSGRAGDRPDEVLSSPALLEVLDALGAAYDVVIIDTPPSLVVSDARLLSRLADGVLVVARENTTSRSLMRDALHGLEQVGAHLYGVVLNAVDFSSRRNSYTYKYYGYGYQYKYAYEEDVAQSPAK